MEAFSIKSYEMLHESSEMEVRSSITAVTKDTVPVFAAHWQRKVGETKTPGRRVSYLCYTPNQVARYHPEISTSVLCTTRKPKAPWPSPIHNALLK